MIWPISAQHATHFIFEFGHVVNLLVDDHPERRRVVVFGDLVPRVPRKRRLRSHSWISQFLPQAPGRLSDLQQLDCSARDVANSRRPP